MTRHWKVQTGIGRVKGDPSLEGTDGDWESEG